MISSLLAFFILVTPLEAQLKSIAAAFRGDVSVFAKNLKTGETAGLNADRRVRTASTIKLPILVETFFQVKEGWLQLDRRVAARGTENRVGGAGILGELSPRTDLTLEDALKLMIELSDNSATNVVLDLVGTENVTRRMAKLGLVNTKSLNKTFRRLPNPTEENKQYGIGSTTPEEMVRLLEMIERREIVDAESCDRMLAILKKQQDWDNIPRYLAGEKVEFALKSGALDQLRADVGIMYTAAGPIALAVYCDHSADQRWTPDNAATVTIGRIARAVYDAWVSEHAVAEFDLVVSRARIVDGAGNPWFPGDAGIKDGRIARLAPYGSLAPSTAARFIDARGMVLAPGFTDVHTHAEEGLVRAPAAANFVLDGVTSIVTGNCGGSRTDLGAYFAELEKAGIGLNAASLVGHNSVRSKIMGTANRQATAEEIAAMRALVEQNMLEGAVGFSTGLIYIPGTYANTQEVVELAKGAASHGGLYASHIRNEGNDEKGGVFEAVREAIQVGEQARTRVEISHFKVANKKLWGQSTRTLQLVEEARRRGVEVTVDQYPYRASSTGLAALLPSWALADGSDAVKQRLKDPATRRKIAAEMVEVIKKRNGRKHLDYAVVARARFDPAIEGRNLTEITRMKKRKATLKNEIETVLDLHLAALEDGSRIQMIYFSMADADVERIMRAPFTMVASDGGITELNVGMPHPRSYATNARVLAYYVREERNIGLEDAIRKMTSLPAQTFRLRNRGLVREGYWADLVLFDPDKVEDKATFEKPHQYSEGFRFVLVNGVPVVEEGKPTGARPGKILYGPGKDHHQDAGERQTSEAGTKDE